MPVTISLTDKEAEMLHKVLSRRFDHLVSASHSIEEVAWMRLKEMDLIDDVLEKMTGRVAKQDYLRQKGLI